MYRMANTSPAHKAAYHHNGLGQTLTGSMVNLINLTFSLGPPLPPPRRCCSAEPRGNIHPVLACNNLNPVSINLDLSGSCWTCS